MTRFTSILACAVLVACSASNQGSTHNTSNDGGGGGGGDGPGGSGTGAGGEGFGGFNNGGSGSGGADPNEEAEVFGHSSSTLYRLDPLTKDVSVVGPFQGCSSVIDLAIDKDNNIFATTFSGLYRIDEATAACTLVSSGSYPNSLSFVPEGTLDPSVEALVGYQSSTYVRIDTNSGAVSDVGALGGGYSSSGDIVSIKDGATFLTVTGNGCSDCLIEVDPATGDMVKNWGAVGHTQVFGLAFWGGSAYGFSNGGVLFEITFGTDTVTATPITIPNPPPNLSFWGAGSSTTVPFTPPS